MQTVILPALAQPNLLWFNSNKQLNYRTRVFFIRVVRLYHVISFLRMSTYRSISADYS